MRKSIILIIAFLVFVSTLFFSTSISYSVPLINGTENATNMGKENDDKTINFYDGDVLISSFKTQKYKDKNVIIIKCRPEPKSDRMFVGWVRDNDDIVYKNGMLIAVKNDVDFHAKYEIVDMDEILKKYLVEDAEEENDDEISTYDKTEDDIEKDIVRINNNAIDTVDSEILENYIYKEFGDEIILYTKDAKYGKPLNRFELKIDSNIP